MLQILLYWLVNCLESVQALPMYILNALLKVIYSYK